MDIRKFILRQTGIVALGEAIGVGAMWGVFALLNAFDSTVLLGGIVGGLVAVGNFFAMAIGVSLAADKAQKQEVAAGQAAIKGSYFVRLLVMALILGAFAWSKLCNPFALVIPLVFVRFTLTIAEFFRRKPGEKTE